jgi:8-amino-7-oxononanoate synthase
MLVPDKIIQKLNERKSQNLYRELVLTNGMVDFYSNDYLGFAKDKKIQKQAKKILANNKLKNGSSGSRLISGNSKLHINTEKLIAKFHKTESALLFNSGYDANLGVLSCIPQLGDIILYDELSHASIRDGIRLAKARAYKFAHNSLTDLKEKLEKYNTTVYVVVESVYSMDGDSPDLVELINLCKQYNAFLIVDEAHALGVLGKKGKGLVNHLKLENDIFASIITYGKAMGCHGAAVLGSRELIDYLINFSRPFIYTTALAPHSVATIKASYTELKSSTELKKLREVISSFNTLKAQHNITDSFIESKSAIQSLVIGDIDKTKKLAEKLANKNIAAKGILHPTVAKGKEQIRFCLHSYNTKKELELLFEVLISKL